MQFFGYRIYVETFPRGYSTPIVCVPVKCIVTETDHVPSDPNEIELMKRIKENAIFENADTPYEEKTLDIRGKIIVLSKKAGFLEIDVTGQRDIPTFSMEDFTIRYKNPVQRDVSHVLENYADAYVALLKNAKYLIQVAIASNPKKGSNLAHVIDFIKK